MHTFFNNLILLFNDKIWITKIVMWENLRNVINALASLFQKLIITSQCSKYVVPFRIKFIFKTNLLYSSNSNSGWKEIDCLKEALSNVLSTKARRSSSIYCFFDNLLPASFFLHFKPCCIKLLIEHKNNILITN